MKLSPPTTKTQKPQRYLTLLYRHLDHVDLSAVSDVNSDYRTVSPYLTLLLDDENVDA
jgi:hypothetical protein